MAMEKLKWGRKKKREFRDWIHNQIENTEGDRASLVRKWNDMIRQHRSRVVGDGISDVPFEGASDLEYPLTGIHFEPVYADAMQTLHLPKDFWSVVAGRPDTVNSAKPLQEFMSVVEKNFLKMRRVNGKALLDNIILGTAIYKNDIKHLSKRVKDYNDQGKIEDVTKIQFNPQVKHVPLERFWIPANSYCIDPDEEGGAPWVAHEFYLTASQLNKRAEGQSPFLPNYDPKAVDDVLKYETDWRDDPVRDTKEREDEYVPFEDFKIRLFEIWARFDIDGDGIAEDVVVVWHQESLTVLRAIHNPFMHGKRPFDHSVYVPSFGFYGVGLAEADEWAQLAMTRLLNTALDNTMVANQRMWGVPLGSDISPNESIHVNKIWFLGPDEQIQPIQMGEVHPSMFQLMDRFSQWSESRTGVSELRQGNIANLPGRTPASTIMSVLQEGNKKFDMILNNIRDPLNRIGVQVLQNLVQISKSDPKFKALAMQTLGVEDGKKVGEFLDGSVHDIEEKFGVSVAASSSQVNKEVEKQSYTALAQIMAQFYPTMLQYAQGIAQFTQDPSIVVSTTQAAYTGQTELLRRVLEAYDVQNPDQYLPEGQAGPGNGQPAPAPPEATTPSPAGAGPTPAGTGQTSGDEGAAEPGEVPSMAQAQLLQSLLGLG